jgi:hypothetical protein
MKKCLDCLVQKPLTDFYKNKRKRDGYDIYCKACMKIRGAVHYQKNKEKINANHKDWVNNNREKMAAYCLKWRQSNPEQNRQIQHTNYVNNKEQYALYDKTRREANIEMYLERERRYYDNNKDKRAAKTKSWRQRNPHMVTSLAARRRAAKKQRTPDWLTKDQMGDMDFMYELSTILTRTTGVQHHVDHIVPLRNKYVSGLHVPWNLQVLPAIDNLKKTNHFTPGRQNATST